MPHGAEARAGEGAVAERHEAEGERHDERPVAHAWLGLGLTLGLGLGLGLALGLGLGLVVRVRGWGKGWDQWHTPVSQVGATSAVTFSRMSALP